MNIEPLESRIAPAIVFNFTDVDGDEVTVKISKGTLADVTFITALAEPLGGEQLQKILLDGLPVFAGANITVTAKPKDFTGDGVPDGDGLVNVGFIDGAGIDLGAVSVKGDLGAIIAGNAETATGQGLKSLSVHSLGRFPATGATVNADGTLESLIVGALGALKVKGDVNGVWIHASGVIPGDEANGKIGAVTIGGSILGGTTKRAGAVNASGDIGAVKIGGDIRGGTFEAAGFLQSDKGKIKSVTLGGSLLGGTANFTGEIRSGSDLGPVKITGDVRGGTAADTGLIAADTGFGPDNGSIASVTIGGSLVGGKVMAAVGSGEIRTADGDIGLVKIGGDVVGGAGFDSGRIKAFGSIAGVTIGGSLIGGTAQHSGEISTSFGGTLLADIGVVNIGGDVVGGGVPFSGRIDSLGHFAGLQIGGSLFGGTANFTGDIEVSADLSTVKIGGSVIGGSLATAGMIKSSGFISAASIGSVVIGGSLESGHEGGAGTELRYNGSINGRFGIDSLTVRGSIVGNADVPVLIFSYGPSAPGANGPAIGKVTVLGRVEFANLVAGLFTTDSSPTGLQAGNADGSIGSVVVSGDWISSNIIAGVADINGDGFGNGDDAKIPDIGLSYLDRPDAQGFISRIASVVIKGSTIGTLASNDAATFGIEAQQIGSIKLGGATVPLKAGAGNDLFIQRRPLATTLGTAPSLQSFDFHAFEVPIDP